MRNKWFDKSDSMIDYFHTAWYNDIKIGGWDKPNKGIGYFTEEGFYG